MREGKRREKLEELTYILADAFENETPSRKLKKYIKQYQKLSGSVDAVYIDPYFSDTRTLLTESILHGRQDITSFLLKRGASLEANLAFSKDTPVTKKLISMDADVLRACQIRLANKQFFTDIIENAGTTTERLFLEADKRGMTDMVRELYRNNGFVSDFNLCASARAGKKEVVDAILKNKLADVNKVMSSSRGKFLPLVEAVRGGNYDIVETLLENGADPNAITEGSLDYSPTYGLGTTSEGFFDEAQTTALIEAAQMGRTDLIMLLVEHGADPTLSVEVKEFEVRGMTEYVRSSSRLDPLKASKNAETTQVLQGLVSQQTTKEQTAQTGIGKV